ncbi:hypothetical protein ODE01S_03270 [Oceanithermus desulfurans NBRC 100063]|uniref:Uncharacterized protein n=2 Tax=Oceanithermus desulfurans TaxID=227924 RepID=A0A511RGW4_9DEIN|nr:hypothetical protein ODE01S_03270 [Oceanithermus desulfurans NBRC 100063]
MVAMERIGFRGLPKDTLEQLKPRLKKLHFPSLKVILVTDRQGRREQARYRVFLVGGKHALLTEDAFGPAYGEEGVRALAQLIEMLRKGGAFNFKEAVLPPDVYAALDAMDEGAVRERLLANANPADPELYAA